MALDAVPQQVALSVDDGRFRFDGLSPRTYVLEARAEDAQARVPILMAVSLDGVRVELQPAFGAVRVIVASADAATPIPHALVEVRDVTTASARTDQHGLAVVRGLDGMTGYLVSVSHPDWAPHQELVVARGIAAPVMRDVVVSLQRGVAIAGSVVDADGHPVPGASVIVNQGGHGDPNRDGVRTDDRGEFALRASGQSVEVRAYHPDHRPSTPFAVTPGAATTPRVHLQLLRGASLDGVAVYADGRPAAFATIRAELSAPGWADQHHPSLSADGHGRFRLAGLASGSVILSAAAPDASTSHPVAVELSTGESHEITLRLDAMGRITGTVVDSRGDGTTGFHVYCVPIPAGPGGDAMGSPRTGAPDEHGAFACTGLSPGRYRIVVTRGPGHSPAAQKEAEIGDEVRLVVADSGSIRGRVVVGGGTVDGVWVRAGVHGVRSERGAFSIPGVDPGRYDVTFGGAEVVSHTMEGIEVRPGSVADLGEITLARGSVVRGVVRGPQGSLLPGATVAVGREIPAFLLDPGFGGVPSQGGRTTSGPGGEFEIAGLGDDPVTVVATHARSGSSVPVVVAPESGRRVELRVVALGTVVATSAAPCSAVLQSVPPARVQYPLPCDGSGRISAEVAAGEYELTWRSSDDRTIRRVRIEPATVTTVGR